jgi:hypothetical protein
MFTDVRSSISESLSQGQTVSDHGQKGLSKAPNKHYKSLYAVTTVHTESVGIRSKTPITINQRKKKNMGVISLKFAKNKYYKNTAAVTTAICG